MFCFKTNMGKGKKRKMVTKKMIKATDKRIKTLQAAEAAEQHAKAEEEANMQVSHVRKEDWLVVFKMLSLFFFFFFFSQISKVRQYPAHLFFSYNTSLGPPYHVLMDTNFINFSIQNKIDIVSGMMDCLYAKCIPYVTDCVMGELEKLGSKFRVAVRIARDPRVQRLTCSHKGTYADDCLVRKDEMLSFLPLFLSC